VVLSVLAGDQHGNTAHALSRIRVSEPPNQRRRKRPHLQQIFSSQKAILNQSRASLSETDGEQTSASRQHARQKDKPQEGGKEQQSPSIVEEGKENKKRPASRIVLSFLRPKMSLFQEAIVTTFVQAGPSSFCLIPRDKLHAHRHKYK
jgi:hypothetical protein